MCPRVCLPGNCNAIIVPIAAAAETGSLPQPKANTPTRNARAPASNMPVGATGIFEAGAGALRVGVFALGCGNGVYAAAAIGTMMALAGNGAGAREGTRMGLWGAAQALALGAGGLIGTALVDLAHFALGSPLQAYAAVFVAEAIAFVASAAIAAHIGEQAPAPRRETSATARVAPQGS